MQLIPDRNFCNAPVAAIRPSPENDDLYGAVDVTDAEFIRLANDIAQNGVREPICVSVDNYVMSGHRRLAASKAVGRSEIPTFVMTKFRRADHSSTEWKRVLASFNKQRKKNEAIRLREIMLELDPNVAHKQLISEREERDRVAPPRMEIDDAVKTRCAFSDRKMQMVEAAVKVVNDLKKYWPVTVRQVHYGLLNDPPLRNSSAGKQRSRYANDEKSYEDLTDVMTRARLLGLIPWEAIADETRPVSGTWYHEDLASFVDAQSYHFLRGYRRDLLQSQADHIELLVEKLTVQNIIEPVAKQFCLPMTVGRGYCSINPRYEIATRYEQSGKDRLVLLIAADFDPDGEAICESFVKSIRDDFDIYDVVATKVLLRPDQVKNWGIPRNELEAKRTSSNYQKFIDRYGDKSVYELEAVSPAQMQAAVRQAIEATIDIEAFNKELAREKRDAVKLTAMKQGVVDQFAELFSGMSENEDEDDDFDDGDWDDHAEGEDE